MGYSNCFSYRANFPTLRRETYQEQKKYKKILLEFSTKSKT